MKKIIILLSIFAIIGCKSKKTVAAKPEEKRIEKMSLAAVDVALKNKAYDLGKTGFNDVQHLYLQAV